MHIVFVCAEFPIHGRPTGGFGTYVDSISKALISKGTKVSIICEGKKRESFIDGMRNIIVLAKLTESRQENTLLSRVISFLNYPVYFSFQVAKELRAICLREKVDIIEGGDFGAELLFYLIQLTKTNPTVVIKLHTPSFVIRRNNDESLNPFYWMMEFMEKMILQRAHHIYSPTLALSRLVAKHYKINVSTIIPYPVKIIVKKKFVHRQSNIVLYVGKLQKKKGVFDLVESIPLILKKYPRSKFIFIGPDTYNNGKLVKDLLTNRIRQLGVEPTVQFIDNVSQEKLTYYYSTATLLVCPSHWENFPNVILEAGSHKLPVVTTPVGGIPEMVLDQKNVLLIPPKSSKKLAYIINKMLNNDQLRKKLAKNLSSHLSSRFAPSLVAKSTLSYYDRILRSSREE